MNTINDLIEWQTETTKRISQTKKKILILGFNDAAKGILFRLAEQGIYVDGFVLEKSDTTLMQIDFLNKKILSMEEVVKNIEKYLIVDLFGVYVKELSDRGVDVCCLFKRKVDDVIIYGAGEQGRFCYYMMMEAGIKIKAFCDKDRKKQTGKYCGINVISLNTVREEYNGTTIVVALDPSISTKVATELENVLPSKIFVYDNSMLSLVPALFPFVGKCSRCEEEITISCSVIHEILRLKKSVILYGNRPFIEKVAVALRQFGIDVLYGIDCNNSPREKYPKKEFEYHSPYDILYENMEKIMVLVFRSALSEARRFVDVSGIEKNIFYQAQFLGSLNHQWMLDPSLGYNVRSGKDESYIKLRTIQMMVKHPVKRIGIVGGSTSDVTLYNEISWPEQLIKIAKKNEINLEVYAAGTCSYVVAQEMIKFIRDLSHLSLDILISYSRVNDGLVISGRENAFMSSYQTQLFNKLGASNEKLSLTGKALNSKPDICWGKGIDDFAGNWLHQEQMMYFMCQGLGIKFYGICQPWLFEKNEPSPYEASLMEVEKVKHSPDIRTIQEHRMKQIREKVRENTLPWLIDFTEIFNNRDEEIYFDSCHLTTLGNQILAEKIYDLIKGDLTKEAAPSLGGI